MHIVRFQDENSQIHYGLPAVGGRSKILQGNIFAGLEETGEYAMVAKLLAPIEPCNILCIGLNYHAHVTETGAKVPEHPVLFMKPTSALNHPGDPIPLPSCRHGEEVDYEAELAVFIKKPAKNVSVAEALEYVLGYTCANDVSARKWQKHAGGGQWVRGKGFDGFCPLGPELVTADEVADPQNLRVQCRVNGHTLQDGNTSSMMFSVAELISRLSRDMTLLPGTVILTGTPDGVGFTREPPVWLLPGDQVEVEIEGIGILKNSVIDAGAE